MRIRKLCFLIGLLEVEICAIERVEMRIQAGLARNSRQSRSVDGIEVKTSIIYGRKRTSFPFHSILTLTNMRSPRVKAYTMLIKHHAWAPAGFNGSAPPFLLGLASAARRLKSPPSTGFVRYEV